MAIVPDLSGNTPLDYRIGGHYDLPILAWRGAQHLITSSGTSQLTPFIARTCRAVRIAPIADIRYEIGVAPVADVNSPFLGGGAVEDLRIKFGERVAILQNSAPGIVTITEDA